MVHAARLEGNHMSSLDRLARRKAFLCLAHRANGFFARFIVVGGALLSFRLGWEILVGSVLMCLALMSAGVLLTGMIEVAEWDYLNELGNVADCDYLDGLGDGT
jgi:hypothetical protein